MQLAVLAVLAVLAKSGGNERAAVGGGGNELR